MSGISLDSIDGAIHSIKVTDGTNILAPNGDGSINISDGGGSITVDGSVTISGLAAEKAEDSAHVSGDTGHFILGVRQDSKASLAGTDGDYTSFIFDADGDLYVSDTVAQGSLSTIAGAVAGSEMQVDIVASLPAGTNNIGDVDVLTMPGIYVEDAASAGGENGMFLLGIRQDADTSPVSADGDYHPFVFNAFGALKVDASLDDTINGSLVVTKVSVVSTAGGTQLIASALANRKEITIQNLGNQDIYIKDGTGATVNDLVIYAKSSATYKWGPGIDVYAITSSGTADVRVLEAA